MDWSAFEDKQSKNKLIDLSVSRLAFLQKQKREAEQHLANLPQGSINEYIKRKTAVAFFENWIHELEKGVNLR